MKNGLTRIVHVAVPALLAFTAAGFTRPTAAQNQQMEERIAEAKEAMARNKQVLTQYSWVEEVNIILRGEQKKQEHFQVRPGPDGRQQKASLDQPPAPPEYEGPLNEHAAEEYAVQIEALIQQYVPPDKELIEQARQKGNISLSPTTSADGQFRLVFSSYIKQSDNMILVIDKAQKDLVSLSISTYLDDPKDAVNVSVQFRTILDGPNHVSGETIYGVGEELIIAIRNSNYQRL